MTFSANPPWVVFKNLSNTANIDNYNSIKTFKERRGSLFKNIFFLEIPWMEWNQK
jgi:hypothetical protein